MSAAPRNDFAPTTSTVSDAASPSPSEQSPRAVARWLFLLCAMVFAMVVLGGVTRLTHSGLSMVEWRPLTGVLPPLTDEAWQEAFARYRQFPEFKQRNPGMQLPGFKSIFWLEYTHRMLGRAIALVFLVPFAYFWMRGRLSRALRPKLMLMFLLGAAQGGLGWFMVKSGLVERPDVSQYRLAAHLAAAVIIYGYLLWVAFGLLPGPSGPVAGDARKPIKRLTVALAALVFLTLLSGAFVAGLDAGLAYNTFPLMGGRLLPQGWLLLEPAYRNFFENIVTVQLQHRLLAMAVLLLSLLVWWSAARSGLPSRARLAYHGLLGLVVLQVALGIATLVLRVPVPLAAAHQAGALLVVSAALWALRCSAGGR